MAFQLELAQPILQRFEALLVLLAIELLGKIGGIQDRGRCGDLDVAGALSNLLQFRGVFGGLDGILLVGRSLCFGDRALQIFEEDAHRLHAAKRSIVGLDQIPRSIPSVRELDHFIRGAEVLLIVFDDAAILPGEPPTFVGVELQVGDALFLLGLGNVEPQFHHEITVIGQLALVLANLSGDRFDSIFAGIVLHPILEKRPVPGSIEEDEVPSRGKVLPEAPEKRARLGLLIGTFRGAHAKPARIERMDEVSDRVSLAGRLPAFEKDDDGNARGANSLLCPTQLLAELGDFLAGFTLLELQAEIKLFEHARFPPSSRGCAGSLADHDRHSS